ncbi:putative membrane protein [Halapricum desulfuricans]|uniref:Putative membrane protein n=1 Tax=Halapricum desulfuricans TaxID=2841257 RepID=A0A897NHY2_9EURY|nr:hypothetical protein [Halapricum desulfuricans]QSG12337.1 putative membrane protein [Halapricum desulfuricans]
MTLSVTVNVIDHVIGLAPRTYTFSLPVVSRLSEIVGLGSLLYSLLITPAEAD